MSYRPDVEDESKEPKVTPIWFVPFSPVDEDRWRVKLFIKAWENHTKKEGEFGGGGFWCERIKSIIGDAPLDGWERAARVTASIIAWFGYNNGYFFLDQALNKLDFRAPSYDNLHNIKTMLDLWSYENSLYRANSGQGGRTLENLLSIAVKRDNPLTVQDMDTAERLMLYIARQEGRTFFRNLLQKADKMDRSARM